MLSRKLALLFRRQMVGHRCTLNLVFADHICTPSTTTDQVDVAGKSAAIQASSSVVESKEHSIPQLWEDPWAHALGPPPPPPEFTKGLVESKEEFKWVLRLLPRKTIPEVPKHSIYPTPSGWIPPKSPPPDLPYFIPRDRHHLFPLHLSSRRDDLDPNTLEYNYVEVIILKPVEGDVFACEEDLSAYLENKLGRKVATHVNELQGKISVKGADRTLLEQFLVDKGF